MTARKSKFCLLSALLYCLLGPAAFAGDKTGNGGDHIRANYLRMGESVLDFLKGTREGQALKDKHGLSLERLNNSLLAEKISVVEGTLLDSQGSIVDATGEPGKILLDKASWKEHIDRKRDVHYLVFHEMLRENGVNDDDYRISKALNPFKGNCCGVEKNVSEQVRVLRAQFQMARRPKVADLRLGQSWTCYTYNADKEGRSAYVETAFHFEADPKNISKFRHVRGQYVTSFYREFDPVRNEFGELSGRFDHGGDLISFDHVRINQGGDLVVEHTTALRLKGHSLTSLANNSHLVINYHLCKTNW